jgi:thiol-disulfide isomerase/thioredoxin
MKKFFNCLIGTFLFLSVLTTSAQPKWYDNFSLAKAECKKSGRLMVIDFWAEWCKPCKVMEKELWNNADLTIQYENFVAVKINVDTDKTTPENFLVTGIPKLVITLPDGEVLWEKTGFYVAEDYTDVLNSIPEDVTDLYRFYFSTLKLTKDSECSFNIANQFQQLASKTSNSELRNAFILEDEKYFKKSVKDNTDPSLTCDIEFYLLLNDVYKGNADKAIKKFNKMGGIEKCSNKELAHFLLASCYKSMNQTEDFNREYQLLESEDFKSRLN